MAAVQNILSAYGRSLNPPPSPLSEEIQNVLAAFGGNTDACSVMGVLHELTRPIESGTLVPDEAFADGITKIAVQYPDFYVRLWASSCVLKPTVIKYPHLADTALERIESVIKNNPATEEKSDANETRIVCVEEFQCIGSWCQPAAARAMKLIASSALSEDTVGPNVPFPDPYSAAHLQGVVQSSLGVVLQHNNHNVSAEDIVASGAFDVAKAGMKSRHAYVREHAMYALSAFAVVDNQFADAAFEAAKDTRTDERLNIGGYGRSFWVLAELGQRYPRLAADALEVMATGLTHDNMENPNISGSFNATRDRVRSLSCDLSSPSRPGDVHVNAHWSLVDGQPKLVAPWPVLAR